MNENEFEHDGKVYVQLKIADAPCKVCSLYENEGCLKAPCSGDVIFMEKHQ